MGTEREKAESLEREGRIDDAAMAFVAAGSLADAVRVFAEARRYIDAGVLIMKALRSTPSQVGMLRGERRRLAHHAACYFAADGDFDRALTILNALGDGDGARRVELIASGQEGAPAAASLALLRFSRKTPPPPPSNPQATGPSSRPSGKLPRARASRPRLDAHQARELAAKLEARGELDLAKTAYAGLGAYEDVARLAESMGDLVEAARAWAQAGRHDEAARCQMAAGDEANALEQLLQLPVGLAGYREAALRAIGLARTLSRLDRSVEVFVEPLLSTGVARADELGAFYDLACLYQSQGHPIRARRVFEQIQAYQPRFRDVAQRVALLQGRARLGNGDSVADEASDDAIGERWESHQRLPEIHRSWPQHLDSGTAPKSGTAPQSGMAPRSDRPSAGRDTSIPPSEDAPGRRPSQQGRALTDSDGLAVGTTIGGRYRVKRRLGEGGTSEIYEVLDLELDAIVALKLFSARADIPNLLERCRRELMLARELTHENIVRVYDMGSHEDRRFITMEMLEGSDLRDVMDACRPSWKQSLRYLVQACHGLHAAHLRGVVHRDVKPENLFVTNTEQVKVTDFGIALRATDTGAITVGGIAGTPVYMSPDQIRDYSGVGPSSDIYSLGIVAYELLTGEVPFDSDNGHALLLMHIKEAPPPPRWLEPELPAELEALILQALEKSPDQRIKSCREMAERLEAIGDEMP